MECQLTLAYMNWQDFLKHQLALVFMAKDCSRICSIFFYPNECVWLSYLVE